MGIDVMENHIPLVATVVNVPHGIAEVVVLLLIGVSLMITMHSLALRNAVWPIATDAI